MKKLAFLLAALSLLSLAACTKAEDPNNLFELPEGAVPAPTQEKEAAPPEEDGYAYGNMQKNRDFVSYQGKILFLNLKPDDPNVSGNGKSVMYSLDKETNEVSPFCTDAACSHVTYITSKCPTAYAVGNLEQYQGKLYMICTGMTDDDFGCLYPTVYKNGKFRKLFDGDIRGFVHGNGNLYARTEDSSLLVLPKGSRTPKILLDEYTSSPKAVFGNFLYGSGSKGITRVDLEAEDPQEEVVAPYSFQSLVDKNHIYYVSAEDCRLYRCNTDGSGQKLLLQEPISPISLNFDEDYLYYRLYDESVDDTEDSMSCDLYRLSKDGTSEPEKIATLPMSGYWEIYVIPGYDNLLVCNFPHEPPYGNQYYLVPKSGGSLTRVEIPDV